MEKRFGKGGLKPRPDVQVIPFEPKGNIANEVDPCNCDLVGGVDPVIIHIFLR